MKTELLNKQEQLLSTFKKLKEAMPLLSAEELLKMSFAYVFTDRDTEPSIKPLEGRLDPKVATLRGMRIHAGISQENASKGIHKAKTYVLRLETGKVPLDRSTEKKLTDLYSKKEETT